MICGACGFAAEQQPCERCRKDPLLRAGVTVRLDEALPGGRETRCWRGLELGHAWPVRVVELRRSGEALEQALRAAQRLVGVAHPALPRLLDVSQPAPGRLLLISEWLPGATLDAAWRGPVPEAAVLDLADGLLATLRTLERLSLAHTALAPGAVQLRSARQVVLLGLGGLGPAPAKAFVAPEGAGSAAADRYAAGAIAAALLAGDLLAERLPAVDALTLRPSTRALLRGLLAADPAQRLSADAALRLVDAAREEPPVVAPSPPPTRAKPRPSVAPSAAAAETQADTASSPQELAPATRSVAAITAVALGVGALGGGVLLTWLWLLFA